MSAIWTCTAGSLSFDKAQLPDGSDLPVRRAVEAALAELGVTDTFIFSGWGQNYLDEAHLAVVENRSVLDNPAHQEAWKQARQIVEDLIIEGPADSDDQRTSLAVSALGELIFHLGQRVRS